MSGDVDQEMRELLAAGARERPRRGARGAVVAGAARRLAWQTLRPWLLIGGLGAVALVAIGTWPADEMPAPEPPSVPSPSLAVPAPGPAGEPASEPAREPASASVRRATAAQPAEVVAPPEPADGPQVVPRRPVYPGVQASARRRTVAEPPPAPPELEPVADPSTLQQEVALLGRAHRALENDDPRAALAALAEHRARFPDGVLGSDRDAATWVARCAIDPSARPQGLAHAASNPRAPLASRIRAACTDGGNP